jgi:hypothetical protein
MARLPLRKLRARGMDTALVATALVLIATPLLPVGNAAPPVLERGITVDQRVKPTAMISMPIDGDFQISRSGKSTGSVKWDIYTTARQGYKLAVNSVATPALWDDSSNKETVGDYDAEPKAWAVGAGDRRFGFSATGTRVLSEYDASGDKRWRGFNGKRPIEVARYRGGALPVSRTTVWLASEMRNPLPASARMNGLLVATAMVNL